MIIAFEALNNNLHTNHKYCQFKTERRPNMSEIKYKFNEWQDLDVHILQCRGPQK